MQNPLKTPLNVLNRLQRTVSVTGLSALRVAKGEKPDANLLRETFENLGTTYIKIGQFIASTPSIFPRDYVLAFQGCLDQTTPLPFSYIERVLKQELAPHGSLNDHFAHIDEKPLASASIAQVHVATLHDGREVVLKVQKPDVETVMQTDLGVLYAVVKVLELTVPNFKFARISPIIDEIKTQMLAETDFISEANNIEDFWQFLRDTGNTRVVAPEVIGHLTTKRVLTMTRLHGMSMIDEQAMRAYCDDPAQVMADTLNTWFASLMFAKSFHADLHAGNLMLLTDGRIGFLDFGIVGKLQPESWQACMGMMQALQVEDYAMMAECMIDMGMTHGRDKVDTGELERDLTQVMRTLMAEAKPYGTPNASQKPVNDKAKNAQAEELNKMMLEIVTVGKRHGIHFPRDFALLTKQMLYFDRFMRTLAPDMDMFTDARVNLLGGR